MYIFLSFVSYIAKIKGMKKATHHTRSLPLPLRPPDAPPALGAGGMPVPCEVAVELGATVVLKVLRNEVLVTTALDATEVDA